MTESRRNGSGASNATIVDRAVEGIAPPPPIEAIEATNEQLRRTYVSSTPFVWLGQFLRALPWPIDELAEALGDDIYQRMLLDPHVAALVNTWKTAIIEDGLHFAPAIDDRTDPDYDLAISIRDEAEAVFLTEMQSDLDMVMMNMLDAGPMGNKIAEATWSYQKPYQMGGPKLMQPTDITVKPRQATAIVVDGYMHVVGVLGQWLNQASPVITGWVIDPKNPPFTLLPADKFWIAQYRTNDADPRGTSLLRPAYDPWWRKRQVIPSYLQYLSVYAIPLVYGVTPEKAMPTIPTDAQGNPLPPAPGFSGPITPEMVMLEALKSMRNGSVMAFPYGSEVHTIAVQSAAAQPFLSAIAQADDQITECVLLQKLATQEGSTGTRAMASVHQDTLDTLIRQNKRWFVRTFIRDLLRPWVLKNWGEDARHLMPKASLGVAEQHDLATMWTAGASLYTSGYPHPSQYGAMDEAMGLPPRDLTEDASDFEVTGGPPNQGDPEAQPVQPAVPGQPAVAAGQPGTAGAPPTDKVSPPVPSTGGPGSPTPQGSIPGANRAPRGKVGTPHTADHAHFAHATPEDNEPLDPVPAALDPLTPQGVSHVAQFWDRLMPAWPGLILAGRTGSRWSYSRTADAYRGQGRTVAGPAITKLRDGLLDARPVRVAQLAEQVAAKAITVAAWERGMRQVIADMFTAQYALGKGGALSLTDADWQRLFKAILEQWRYLSGFATAVQTGEMSEKAIAARSMLYLGASAQAFEMGRASAFGVELPAYPGDGSSVCMSNDRCAWQLERQHDGSVRATWQTERDKKVCPTCAERGRDWAPLIVYPQPAHMSLAYLAREMEAA